MYEIIKKKW